MTNKPWETEPDSKEWMAHGYRCQIKRIERSGHLSGYVTVPDSHPWFGLSYGDKVTPIADPSLDECSIIGVFCLALSDASERVDGRRNMDTSIAVHGGVTYGENEGCGWTIGFDCAHSGDYCPAKVERELRLGFPDRLGTYETYRDMDYVTRETERLAEQLKQVEERGTR